MTPPSGKHVSRDRRVAILTGVPGSGKTTVCLQLLDRARQDGLDCAGVVCPARFDGTHKVGIDLLEARSGERRSLATMDELPARLRAGPYRFDEAAVARGVACLGLACPCDVLIVDEIGPLEMERGEGWVDALDVLRAGRFRLAVVVVRPGLVDTVRMAIGAPGCVVVRLPADVPGRDSAAHLLSLV